MQIQHSFLRANLSQGAILSGIAGEPVKVERIGKFGGFAARCSADAARRLALVYGGDLHEEGGQCVLKVRAAK